MCRYGDQCRFLHKLPSEASDDEADARSKMSACDTDTIASEDLQNLDAHGMQSGGSISDQGTSASATMTPKKTISVASQSALNTPEKLADLSREFAVMGLSKQEHRGSWWSSSSATSKSRLTDCEPLPWKSPRNQRSPGNTQRDTARSTSTSPSANKKGQFPQDDIRSRGDGFRRRSRRSRLQN
ncbi:MAG: hypothetical protein MHM6MM_005325 [Cercozoa sp. M6MM]